MPKKPARKSQSCVLFLNGPNLGTLGVREPSLYGTTSLKDIVGSARQLAVQYGVLLKDLQSNHEGDLIDCLNSHFSAMKNSQSSVSTPNIIGIVINPGALAHTSIALRDALAMFDSEGVAIAEVHLSNIYRRETFRHQTVTSGVVSCVVSGMGPSGYYFALEWILKQYKQATQRPS